MEGVPQPDPEQGTKKHDFSHVLNGMILQPYGSKDPLLGMHGKGAIWGVKYLLRRYIVGSIGL